MCHTDYMTQPDHGALWVTSVALTRQTTRRGTQTRPGFVRAPRRSHVVGWGALRLTSSLHGLYVYRERWDTRLRGGHNSCSMLFMVMIALHTPYGTHEYS